VADRFFKIRRLLIRNPEQGDGPERAKRFRPDGIKISQNDAGADTEGEGVICPAVGADDET
jgi:hypothetical protein